MCVYMCVCVRARLFSDALIIMTTVHSWTQSGRMEEKVEAGTAKAMTSPAAEKKLRSIGHTSPAHQTANHGSPLSGKKTETLTPPEKRPQTNGHASPGRHATNSSNGHTGLDGYLKTDDRMRLAKERREERERSLVAREQAILEKERRARLQYERTVEERWRKLEEQRMKEEQRRAAVEEKRRQQLEEEKVRLEALMRKSLERSLQLENRNKRWTWNNGGVQGDWENAPPPSAVSALSHDLATPSAPTSESGNVPASPHRSPYRGSPSRRRGNPAATEDLGGGARTPPNTPKKESLRRERRMGSPVAGSPVRRSESPAQFLRRSASPSAPRLTARSRNQSPVPVHQYPASPLRYRPAVTESNKLTNDKQGPDLINKHPLTPDPPPKKSSNTESPGPEGKTESQVKGTPEKRNGKETENPQNSVRAVNVGEKSPGLEKKPQDSNSTLRGTLEKISAGTERNTDSGLPPVVKSDAEACRVLAEKRRQARVQKEQDDHERLKAEQLRAQKQADERVREEKEKRREEEEKERDVERQRMERELMKQHEDEERQQRKKRIEEIMKRTRKSDGEMKREDSPERLSPPSHHLSPPGEIQANPKVNGEVKTPLSGTQVKPQVPGPNIKQESSEKIKANTPGQVQIKSPSLNGHLYKEKFTEQKDRGQVRVDSTQVKVDSAQVRINECPAAKVQVTQLKGTGENNGQKQETKQLPIQEKEREAPKVEAPAQVKTLVQVKAPEQTQVKTPAQVEAPSQAQVESPAQAKIFIQIKAPAQVEAKSPVQVKSPVSLSSVVKQAASAQVKSPVSIQVKVQCAAQDRSVKSPGDPLLNGQVKQVTSQVTSKTMLKNNSPSSLPPLPVSKAPPPLINLQPAEKRGGASEESDEVQSMEVSPVSKEELISIPEFSPVMDIQNGVSSNERALEDLLDLTGHVAYPRMPQGPVLGDCNKNLIEGVCSPSGDNTHTPNNPPPNSALSKQH
ncbi:MAP7 domain-containing protein 2a isoform X2 [Hoplias malabaricus]|uniref:MAP7 domain-containing protein 2a isoform X2 n=1 Tax=Hoplias malabaricus TaxID=27720 RepID=UPI0034632786